MLLINTRKTIVIGASTLLIGATMITLIVFLRRETGSNSSPIVSEQVLDEKIYEIKSGDTFSEILLEQGNVSGEEISGILSSIQELFDVTKIRAGDAMKFIFNQGALTAVAFDVDKNKTLTISKEDDQYVTEVALIEYIKKEASVQGVIENSFYMTGIASGLTDKAIMNVAQIFSWDIDFATNIQAGDSFSVVYDNTYRDGVFVGVGDIKAARFTNEGEEYFAFMVEFENGTKKYYNELGESTERLLLKTPLNFSRISSNFSYSRKNPVNGNFAAHRAVDLAAPTGTPIESVGSGVVEYAGWNGGYGKYIRIRHDNGFKTAYAHLSSISSSVKKGGTVKQGQLIGAVGSTGNSTGPHLHYEVWKNGTPVNPFTVKLPSGASIPESEKMKLDSVMNEYRARIQ